MTGSCLPARASWAGIGSGRKGCNSRAFLSHVPGNAGVRALSGYRGKSARCRKVTTSSTSQKKDPLKAQNGLRGGLAEAGHRALAAPRELCPCFPARLTGTGYDLTHLTTLSGVSHTHGGKRAGSLLVVEKPVNPGIVSRALFEVSNRVFLGSRWITLMRLPLLGRSHSGSPRHFFEESAALQVSKHALPAISAKPFSQHPLGFIAPLTWQLASIQSRLPLRSCKSLQFSHRCTYNRSNTLLRASFNRESRPWRGSVPVICA